MFFNRNKISRRVAAQISLLHLLCTCVCVYVCVCVRVCECVCVCIRHTVFSLPPSVLRWPYAVDKIQNRFVRGRSAVAFLFLFWGVCIYIYIITIVALLRRGVGWGGTDSLYFTSVWMSFVVLTCESLHVCTACIWRSEHARFCQCGYFQATCINFHSFILSSTHSFTYSFLPASFIQLC